MEAKEENHGPGMAALPPATAVAGREENLGRSAVAPPAPAAGTVGAITTVAESFSKKRGRPRKYGPDGKPAGTLSPMPISASIPLAGDVPGWKQSQGKPISSIKGKHLEFCTPGDIEVGGEGVAHSLGDKFTPHVMTVCSGEDVNMKIISFAQQGTKAICVLAANGSVSNVTLRQPNSCGGTLTYEGRFDILSLSGAFMPSDNIQGAKGRSGGMTVSLAGPDGRVLGGGLAGMLVAAGPVQVILGSFIPDHQKEEQKPKKTRFEQVTPALVPPIATAPVFKESTDRPYGFESNISFTPTNPRHDLNLET